MGTEGHPDERVIPNVFAFSPNIQMTSGGTVAARKEVIVEDIVTVIAIEETQDEAPRKSSSEHSGPEDEYKIDRLFYRICYFCFILGVNFYRNRSYNLRCISIVIVAINCGINLYFIGYVAYLSLSKKFDADRVATSIGVCTWVLQATLSTIFLAHWQASSQTCSVLKLLYEAHQGVGIHHHRKRLVNIVNMFYFNLGIILCYYISLMIANWLDYNVGYTDPDIPRVLALFIFSLLVHSTHYEFLYYNEQVRSLLPRGDRRHSIMEPTCSCDHSIDEHCTVTHEVKYECWQSDEALCAYLLKLIKIHNRLTECVKRLDRMFNRYAFVMIATIIPTTIFSLFMVTRRPERYRCLELFFSSPLVFFCVFSFFALVNAPSQLHNTIYTTKSALCANTHIWFPYRPNVYHSALAFVAHLDQTNLGVSIWGFAVVSKPLVLTTLSVMVTCLALFLQLGDCSSAHS